MVPRNNEGREERKLAIFDGVRWSVGIGMRDKNESQRGERGDICDTIIAGICFNSKSEHYNNWK